MGHAHHVGRVGALAVACRYRVGDLPGARCRVGSACFRYLDDVEHDLDAIGFGDRVDWRDTVKCGGPVDWRRRPRVW